MAQEVGLVRVHLHGERVWAVLRHKRGDYCEVELRNNLATQSLFYGDRVTVPAVDVDEAV